MYKIISLLCVFLIAQTSNMAFAQIQDVRMVGDGSPTRVTVYSGQALEKKAFSTNVEGSYQIVVPVGQVEKSQKNAGSAGIKHWSVSGAELKLDLIEPMLVSRILRLPPTGSAQSHRLIIDLQQVSQTRFTRRVRKDVSKLEKSRSILPVAQLAEAATPKTPSAPSPEAPSNQLRTISDALPWLNNRSNRRYVVVIDAGHGGKDPGAQAISGGVEKTYTLRAALTLRDLLQQDSRYIVRLTRDNDTFIELEDRVSKARNFGADLFISLHADAAGSRSVEGASVYTISAKGERRINREASRNDWKIPIEDGTTKEVGGILEDLVKRETKTRSAEFAEILLPKMAEAGPVLRNTHRNASFFVLLAPDVPAVLLEMGFLTNHNDAKRLKSKSGREKLMKSVKTGIDAFFDQQDLTYAKHTSSASVVSE